jgi:Fic family protein
MSNEIRELIERLIKQNEIIISLLGRIAFKPEDIKEIVTTKKRNPQKYIDGYNACDGEHSVAEIAKIVGVKPGTLSPILKEWERIGIVYEVKNNGGKFYKKLFTI